MEIEDNKREMMSAVIGSEISDSEPEISSCKYNPHAAIDCTLGTPELLLPPSTFKKTVTTTGVRISPQVNDVQIEISKGSEELCEVEKMNDVVEVECSVKMEEGMVVGCEGNKSKGSDSFDVVNSEKEQMLFDDIDAEPHVKNKEETVVGCGEIVSKCSEFVDMGKSEEGEVANDPMEVEPNVKIKEETVVDWGKDALKGCQFSGDGKSEKTDGLKVESDMKVKEEENNESLPEKGVVLDSRYSKGNVEVRSPENFAVKEEPFDCSVMPMVKDEPNVKVKEEPLGCEIKEEKLDYSVTPKVKNKGNNAEKMEVEEVVCVQPLSARPLSDDEYKRFQNSGNSRNMFSKGEKVENRALSTVVIEDGDFTEEPDWLLVGRDVVMGLSTSKGRKLENNEIVHFAFPNGDARCKGGLRFSSSKASSVIVRFSTKRNGEIGRLPMEWGKCLIPLVNSSKVKVQGRCIAAPANLQLMQEIMLYISFYIHHSVFTNGDKSSWRLDGSSYIDTTTYPLLTLFKLLKIKPFQEAEFTPEELNSRKRGQMLEDEGDVCVSVMPLAKRIKGVPPKTEQKDEQAISESTLNKLVGAADMYDLKEMEAPDNLMCDLRSYQKQALFWMTESEKCVNVEEAPKTVHPCWGSYRICDERAPAIYVNVFSGEATTKFPNATESSRGGILADAMGLGKTVMTIALILARRERGTPEKQESNNENVADTEYIKKKRKERDTDKKVSTKVKGGTLIVCPMALLGQWKDELESHSKPDSLSVFVHYGGDRSTDPKVIAEPDVILTTYGVLSAAYKNNGENSIFHIVEWHRVVLDEAHIIKSSRALVAQAAFALSSYCRWCLTGTPLQNNLEDLYSLLCFLHVEPWCNWAWWQKFIQKPYENGDQRGLKLVKAILRPLMLRRTKETKDKEGRPILVLPPTDIKIIECEQSEAEFDFYDALFKRSKVQFDQFVAQGKVLHNYANILELLLRLRQCCNHPFLVMSRGDTQRYADLNKLATRFFEANPDSIGQNVPSRAYVEEVVEGLRNGENAECPICLESADDPVLTPCAHRMCRECLLSSWRTPAGGACPICRQVLKKADLITCPSETRFRIDIEKNWKESSKVSKLLECLEHIHQSDSGEKSIVFSQWTSFLDLLEIPLKRRKIGYLRFDGKLVQKQRERVLKEFNETGEKMVLLMSLKAGGVGLNLTAASNVFLMDPWWNPAVEEQAIMRIHRIGQKRTVRVRRFIVKGTVEQRLQQVQAKKQRMIAGALTDEEVRSARLEELKMLFR